MNFRWFTLIVCFFCFYVIPGITHAQGRRLQSIEPAKPDEIKEFLLSGDAEKIYRALIVKDAPQLRPAMKPLWKFLSQEKDTAFRVRDRTVKGYHMVNVLPLVRKELAGYGADSYELIDQGFQSKEIRKRVEACRVSGLLIAKDNQFFRRLITASEDDHGFVRIAALRALPVYGKDAINPLFRRLKRCSAWQKGGKFSFEEIDAICRSLKDLDEFASDILPKLAPYLDRGLAPDAIVKTIAEAGKRLSYSNEPETTKLILPAFQRLKRQGILAQDAEYLQQRYNSRMKIEQGSAHQSTTRSESKSK